MPASRKSQFTIFFIVVIVVLIVITMVTINIGKIAKDKTYTENSADAGALAAGAVSAYAFNYAAHANRKEGDGFEGNYDRFIQHLDEYIARIQKKASDTISSIIDMQQVTCCSWSLCANAVRAPLVAFRDIGFSQRFPSGSFRYKMFQLIKKDGSDQTTGQKQQAGTELGVIPNYWKLQADFLYAVKERVQDDGSTGGGNDLYSAALKAGYQYNLYNSGFPVKMGEDAKEFYEWVNNMNPQNCTPQTYNWTDAAGRPHMVTATVCIDSMLSWTVNHTASDRAQIEQDMREADRLADEARSALIEAGALDGQACACLPFKPCGILKPTCDCYGPEAQANIKYQEAIDKIAEALLHLEFVRMGLEPGGSQTITGKKDMDPYIIVDIDNINHSRNVTSTQFQFHGGGVVKGPRGDVDAPTVYPPVQSSSGANFGGRVGQNGIRNKNPAHDASLSGGF